MSAAAMIQLEKQYCFKCGKPQDVLQGVSRGKFTQLDLSCGHSVHTVTARPTKVVQAPLGVTSTPEARYEPTEAEVSTGRKRHQLWNKLYEFQKVGVEFIESAIAYCGGCINEDDMGSGKTIMALSYLRENPQAFPVLIVVPPPLTYKWQRECKKWLNVPDTQFTQPEYTPFIWSNPYGNLIEDHKIFIVSSGMLARTIKDDDGKAKTELLNALSVYGFKTVIFDEAHYYKNDNSQRTDAFKQLTKLTDNVITLTGTPVENRLMEYYNLLHATNPSDWYKREVLADYCAYTPKGIKLGLAESSRSFFHLKVKPYVIRRTKAEILPDLPEKRINYSFIDLRTDKGFVLAYNKGLDELEALIARKSEEATGMIKLIAIMAKLRHLVGLYKVTHIVDEVLEFIENVPDEKVCIGAYHELVHEQFTSLLTEAMGKAPLSLFRKSVKDKDAICEKWRTDIAERICIFSIAADREGRDAQFCPNVWIAERDWNKSRENQFQDRFHRIGLKTGVHYEYPMGAETIDMYLHDMVEFKGHVSETATNPDFTLSDEDIMNVAESMVQKRLKYVG